MAAEDRIASKAFIYQDDCFLLQHRDNDPNIYHPDHWGLFGGRVDLGETPEQCLLRELDEELNLRAKRPYYLYLWETTHLYLVSLDVSVAELELREGMAMALLNPSEILSLKLAPEVRYNMDAVLSCMKSME